MNAMTHEFEAARKARSAVMPKNDRRPVDQLEEWEVDLLDRLIDSKAGIRPVIPASFPIGAAWFVVAVLGGEEAKVAKTVKEKLKFETFCPMQTFRRVKRDRKITDAKPVFQGYVFVKFDRQKDDWGRINKKDVDGVRGIVATDGLFPLCVPDEIMRQLMDWDSTGYFDASNKLRAGEEVEITEGPLAGLIARVKAATARKRNKIVLDYILGSIEVDPCFLRRA